MSYAMLCYAIILQRSSSSRRWLTHLFLGSAWCRDLVLGPRTGDEQESQMAPPHYSKWYRVTSTLETPQPRSMAKLRRMSRINTACDWLEVVEIHLSVDNKSSALHHQGGVGPGLLRLHLLGLDPSSSCATSSCHFDFRVGVSPTQTHRVVLM